MKKILIASILFAGMNTIFLPCSSAVSINSPVESIQEPRYEQITNINAKLTISAFGKAICSGKVQLRDGYNVKMTTTLKKKESSGWITVKSWSDTGSGHTGVNKDYTYSVSKGTYYVQLTAYVTNSAGKYIETQYDNSVKVTY